LQAGEDCSEAVFAVEASCEQLLTVLCENVCEVSAHNVAEDDWVGDLHHGCLQVRGEEDTFCLCASDLLDEECVQCLCGHDGCIKNFAFKKLEAVLEDGLG